MEPLEIGSATQLFLDDRFFLAADGVDLVVHPPEKVEEPCLVADRPWEGRVWGYGTVLRGDDGFLMWYTVRVAEGPGYCISLARSADGIRWEKPELGLAREIEDGRNNIVMGYGAAGLRGSMEDCGHHVFQDPRVGPEERYGMLIRPVRGGLVLFRSPDGLAWKPTGITVLDDLRRYDPSGTFLGKEFHLDSQNVVFWDGRIGKYVAYVRRNFERNGQLRTVARGESPSLSGFPHPRDMPVVLCSDDLDPRAPSPQGFDGEPVSDFYTSAAVRYEAVQDSYFMFPSAYHKFDGWFADFHGGKPLNAGAVDIRFAASRDGVTWRRYGRRPFVRLGVKGRFDSGSLYMLYGIAESGPDSLFLYYFGTDHLHGWAREDAHRERNDRLLSAAGLAAEHDLFAVGRLCMRRDGFVSARGSYRGGEFVTPPMRFSGSLLALNADLSALGMIRIEMQDGDGAPLPGFSMRECVPVHSVNSSRLPVRWGPEADLARLAGRPVRMRVAIRDADLYSFRFTSGP